MQRISEEKKRLRDKEIDGNKNHVSDPGGENK